MKSTILVLASFLGAFSVLIGAMGSHVFEDYLISLDRVDTFEVAIRYQFYHIFLLLAIGICYNQFNQKLLKVSFFFSLLGLLLFCGSLYLICLTGTTLFGVITPFGGLSFVFAWLSFAFSIIKKV